jgi:cell division septation protein DedD
VKERLTGAIILVALMVLLVPELLTGPIGMKSSPAGPATVASSSAASSIAAASPAAGTVQPAQGEPPLRTYTMTLGAAPAQSTQATSAATSALPQGEPAEGRPSASTAQEATPSIPAKPAPASAQAPGQDKARRHAAAPEPATARSTAVKPASHVLPSRSHPQRKSSDRPALQVTKPAAHRTVREARAPASPAAGWVVQLGVFADHRNAVRLAGMLQRRGFRIAVSPLRVRSRALWRVSTPPQSHAAALHVAARLRAAGHRGEVLPAR